MRQCENTASSPDSSDFENWVPKDDEGDNSCLLGSQVTYIRRKRDRKCVVGEKYQSPKITQQTCKCRDIDYEW
jgi:hypothetical protein